MFCLACIAFLILKSIGIEVYLFHERLLLGDMNKRYK